MGRQAYLAKIAFGRSAFEPTQSPTESTEYVQLESSHSELPRLYQEATANNYIQLYDERGNPVNPRSHAYGKKLRDAQNDVLASVGVVERRRSPSEGLPGSYGDRLESLQVEDTVGNAIALTTTLGENLCTWWTGIMRDRILTFRYHDAIPFAQIVAMERAISGTSLLYAGFAPRLLSALSVQAIIYTASIYQITDRILLATQASARTRSYFRKSRTILKSGFRLALEVLFYPLSYHAFLQKLGLLPATPLLPSWRSFIPFSESSPLIPLSIYYNPYASLLDCMKAMLTSPALLVIADQYLERWVHASIHEAIELSIIRPNNADIQGRDTAAKDRARTILGLRRRSPPVVRKVINSFLTFIGWGQPLASGTTEGRRSSDVERIVGIDEGQTFDVSDTRVTNITPLELPMIQTQAEQQTEPSHEESVEIAVDGVDEPSRPTSPFTPTASITDQEDNDPRIRITNREGIVEMEVRLPPRILSSHTEAADGSGSLHQGGPTVHHEASSSSSARRPYHRVTRLSSEPAQMISAVVKAQLVGLAILPLRLVALRLVASHFLAGQEGQTSALRTVRLLPSINDLSWRTVGLQISRVALCNALDLAIDLGLWGVQYFTITNIGRRVFGWGTL